MKSGALFIEVQLNVQKQFEFEIFSVTADSSLRSPTGGVEVSCTTPHIYEQKTARTMATSLTCLSTTR